MGGPEFTQSNPVASSWLESIDSGDVFGGYAPSFEGGYKPDSGLFGFLAS